MTVMPQKLNDKHRLIALLMLAGAERPEIAARTGYDPSYISAITHNSPMFKAMLDQLRAEMRQKTIGGVVDRIIQEGPKSVEALVVLRDTAESEQVRVTAARDLLDRNPETAKVSREDRRTETRVVFDGRALAKLAGVLAEDAGQDAATVDAAFTPVSALPLTTGIPTLEELRAELAAQEDDAT